MEGWYQLFNPHLETDWLSCRLAVPLLLGGVERREEALKGLLQCLGTDTDREDLSHVQEPREEELTLQSLLSTCRSWCHLGPRGW